MVVKKLKGERKEKGEAIVVWEKDNFPSPLPLFWSFSLSPLPLYPLLFLPLPFSSLSLFLTSPNHYHLLETGIVRVFSYTYTYSHTALQAEGPDSWLWWTHTFSTVLCVDRLYTQSYFAQFVVGTWLTYMIVMIHFITIWIKFLCELVVLQFT